jgi:hypothetical protein
MPEDRPDEHEVQLVSSGVTEEDGRTVVLVHEVDSTAGTELEVEITADDALEFREVLTDAILSSSDLPIILRVRSTRTTR